MGEMNPIEYFICGGFGGVCTVVTGHPLDTIKVRLQTMPIPKAGEVALYTGTWDCMKKTVAKEGFKGLYKGMGAPLAGVAPIFAISFMGYGVGKQIFGPSKGEHFTIAQYFAAGAFSGIFTTSIMAPGERIKCLLQIQQSSTHKLYNGPVDCAVKLYKQGGIRSVYRGSVATLMRGTRVCLVTVARSFTRELVKHVYVNIMFTADAFLRIALATLIFYTLKIKKVV